ncbi:hypothetical protein ACOME3_005818 [Neoechinorhynchus agilis]
MEVDDSDVWWNESSQLILEEKVDILGQTSGRPPPSGKEKWRWNPRGKKNARRECENYDALEKGNESGKIFKIAQIRDKKSKDISSIKMIKDSSEVPCQTKTRFFEDGESISINS